jgi:hypothetical protein
LQGTGIKTALIKFYLYGKEKTHQSGNGIDGETLANKQTF